MADIYQKLGDAIVRVLKDPTNDLVDIQSQLDALLAIARRGMAIKETPLDTPITANTEVTVPTYIVGTDSILVYVDGLLCREGVTYNEVGEEGSTSDKIVFLDDIPATLRASIVASSFTVGGRVTVLRKIHIDTPIMADEEITVPPYMVGSRSILVYIDGVVCREGITYNEVGEEGTTSDKITFVDNIPSSMHVSIVVSSFSEGGGGNGEGSSGGEGSQGIDSPVFGIALASPGGGSGMWLRCNEDGEITNYTPEYFNNHPIYSNIETVTIDGQIMVRIPKFYVQYITPTSGMFSGRPITFLSPTAKAGYKVHPAFLQNGVEIDQFYLGAYKASLGNDNKYQSIPGVNPVVSMDFDTAHVECAARNVNGVQGFMLEDIYQRAAIQLLMLAEYATTDMQSILGAGHVASTYAVAVDSPTNHTPWRGLHCLWGNVWEMIDGVRFDANCKIEMYKNDGSREFVATNLNMPNSIGGWTGWIVEMHNSTGEGFDMRDVFLPKTSNSTEANGTYADNYFSAKPNCALFVGGGFGDRNKVGMFSILAHHGADTTHTDVGCRLAKI